MVEHLSYSSISAYLSCPAAWKFKYIEKAPTWSTPELVFGTAIHGTLEAHLGGRGALLDVWAEEWTKASTDESRGKILWGAENRETFCNEGIRILSHPAVTAGIEQIKQMYAGGPIERKVELKVPAVPLPIVGYIDITLKDGVPADFKTSSRAWNQDRAQGELQSLFYLAALNQVGETVPGWKFVHFVFVKTKTPQFQVFEHVHKPTEIIWLFSMISKVWKAIERESFPENPTSWKCSPAYCDFWNLCRGRYG